MDRETLAAQRVGEKCMHQSIAHTPPNIPRRGQYSPYLKLTSPGEQAITRETTANGGSLHAAAHTYMQHNIRLHREHHPDDGRLRSVNRATTPTSVPRPTAPSTRRARTRPGTRRSCRSAPRIGGSPRGGRMHLAGGPRVPVQRGGVSKGRVVRRGRGGYGPGCAASSLGGCLRTQGHFCLRAALGAGTSWYEGECHFK